MTDALVPQSPDVLTPVLTGLTNALMIREEWIAQKRAELERAEEALRIITEMQDRGATISYQTMDLKQIQVEQQVHFLQQVVRTMESGYVPIPRFEGEMLNFETTAFPLNVLAAIDRAQATHLFDHFLLVPPSPPTVLRKIDPLVIGVVFQGPALMKQGRQHIVVAEGRQEHFLVAWWRPEDVRPGDSF